MSSWYRNALKELSNAPKVELINALGKKVEIKELRNYSIEIPDCRKVLIKNAVKSPSLRYLAAELIWYFSRSFSSKFIGRHASLWKDISVNDQVNSNYGALIFGDDYMSRLNAGLTYNSFNEFDECKKLLTEDPGSRRAVIHFNESYHYKLNRKDFPCTMYGIFDIRNNKLNFSIFMRSTDIIYGLPYDIVFFSVVLQEMQKYLPDVELGSLYFFTNSFHVYEQNYDLIDKISNDETAEEELFYSNRSLLKDEPFNTICLDSLTGIKLDDKQLREDLSDLFNIDIFRPFFSWEEKHQNE